MGNEVLNVVNRLLEEQGEDAVTSSDPLYSSGLLSSLDMFGLIIELESLGFKLKRGSFSLPLEDIDCVDAILHRIEK